MCQACAFCHVCGSNRRILSVLETAIAALRGMPLEDFAAHCEDGPVKVRLCGDNYDVDFTMSDTMVKWLKTFITLYDEGGALNASYLSDVNTTNTMSTY